MTIVGSLFSEKLKIYNETTTYGKILKAVSLLLMSHVFMLFMCEVWIYVVIYL